MEERQQGDGEMTMQTVEITGDVTIDFISQLREALDGISASVAKAAKIYMAGLRSSGLWRSRVREEFPLIPGYFFKNLERIGMGQLSPSLIALKEKFTKTVGMLPLDEQERLMNTGVPIWVGSAEPRIMKLIDLPDALLDQAVSEDGEIRTPPQQVAYAEGKRLKIRQKAMAIDGRCLSTKGGASYRIDGKVVFIPRGQLIRLTAEDLRRMLALIESGG